MISRILKPVSFLLVFFFLIAATACNKSSSHPTVPDGSGSPTGSSESTAYVLGYSNDTLYYWKNGVPVVVSTSPGTYGSGIAISDTDVYISGGNYPFNANSPQPPYTGCYWKNGILTALSDSTHNVFTCGIAISGSNIYIAGTIDYDDTGVSVPYSAATPPSDYAKFGRVAACWKNGQASPLPGAASSYDYNGIGESIYGDEVNGITATGSDVFVVGGSTLLQPGNTSSMHFTLYWKDSSPIDLINNLAGVIPDSTTGVHSPSATAIYVSGSDVYVAGYQYLSLNPMISQALYWKNGAPNYLTASPNSAYAKAVCVAGNDVYIAGNLQQAGGLMHAVYWKNGLAITLDNSSTEGAYANYIAVSGSDVYVAGVGFGPAGVTYPVFWKNGKMTRLGSNGYVTGLAVK